MLTFSPKKHLSSRTRPVELHIFLRPLLDLPCVWGSLSFFLRINRSWHAAVYLFLTRDQEVVGAYDEIKGIPFNSTPLSSKRILFHVTFKALNQAVDLLQRCILSIFARSWFRMGFFVRLKNVYHLIPTNHQRAT